MFVTLGQDLTHPPPLRVCLCPMASANNDLEVALQPDAEAPASSRSTPFSKRALLLAASVGVGVVCAVEIGHRMLYAHDTDGDGHVSAGEMMSCTSSFFSSCTETTIFSSWNVNGR